MQTFDDEWICPSFNSYSITSKVAGEAAGDIQFNLPTISENNKQYLNEEDGRDNFEFGFINDDFELCNPQIISKFPIFNRELIFEDHECVSSSSFESDEMESIPPGSYCIWKPKVASPSTCKKSKSTGFGSKRWKLRDLLRRSNSDGKDSFVFLTSRRKDKKLQIGSHTWSTDKKSHVGLHAMEGPTPKPPKSTTTKDSGLGSSLNSSSTGRLIYTPANRDIMRVNETPNRSQKGNGEMPKRKSYLPYKQDLVGFFTTVNSLGRNFSQLKMK